MLNYTIKKLHENLKKGNTTVQEVIKTALNRADSVENYNVFISMNNDVANHAENSNSLIQDGRPRSLLEGIPIAVKDNFCVEGLPTTCGSKMLKNFNPTYSATVVRKLINSGAIIIGKTNMDEFAMGSGTTTSVFGPTKNIWHSRFTKNLCENDWFICGGSSGGSAVAVASGICLGALGSDTGGSCRNPASYCGIVGLKPTYGLLSRHGLIPLVNSMDVPGILALNVEDAGILLETMAGQDEKDSTTVSASNLNLNLSSPKVKGLKIGIPAEYNCEGLSNEVKSTWNNIAKLLTSGGATVLPVSMPYTKYSMVSYFILNQCEVASNMARYDGVQYGYRSECNESAEQMFAETRSSGFSEVVRSRILAGNYFLLSRNYEKYFMKALKVRRLICDDFKKVWQKGFNILLTPTTLTDASTYLEYIEKDESQQSATQDYCTQPANMAGCPAISIPIELSKKGLPISLQLMAPNFEEKTLLQTASFIENVVKFSKYR